MKLVKGNKTYPIITGNDVIVTRGSKSLQTVDEAIDNQQKEIEKLKSNMKYIYSYGGVGGNGRGGNGSGVPTKEASLIVTLNGHAVRDGGSPIILGKTGEYDVEVSVRNSNGATFYVKIAAGTSIDNAVPIKMNAESGLTVKKPYNLQKNGDLVVLFLDADNVPIDAAITQPYIVTPHTFDVKFKYLQNGSEGVFSDKNEYFIGDPEHTNPFIDVSYKINVPSVSNVVVDYTISGVDEGTGSVEYKEVTDITRDHLKLKLEDFKKNGEDFLNVNNTGNYNVSVKLTYSASGSEVLQEEKFTFTLIPNNLFINVRNPQDLLYNNLDDLLAARNVGVDGIPAKYSPVGSYVAAYCKVYDGDIKSNPWSYTLTCSVYDVDEETHEVGTTNLFTSNNTQSVTEQVETTIPFSIPFNTPGMKQIVIKANAPKINGAENNPTIKYIYIKESDSKLDWYPAEDIENYSYYFRANTEPAYSSNFPALKSGSQPLELKISDSGAVELTNSAWWSFPTGVDTTVVSFGMQFSKVNKEDEKIVDIYAPIGDGTFYNSPDITMCANRLFTDIGGEICIPGEKNYKSSNLTGYHLVQIARTKLTGEGTDKRYGTYLYIDGVLEAVKESLDNNNWYVGKIVLNNANVIYNLINVQYMSRKDYSLDELVYQYWLKFKETMRGQEISKSESVLLENLRFLKFDGEFATMESASILESISPFMPIPTMMVEYAEDNTEEKMAAFKDALFRGYKNGDVDNTFGHRRVNMYWCEGLSTGKTTTFHQITIPSGTLTGNWFLELQGTSTMRNRIKNFSLGIDTNNNVNDENILVSPNYNENDPHTFLPERIWTIKADVADSAHANNTSIGKFVNRVCKTFSTGQNYQNEKISAYIKNTLEGFPILMYYKIGSTVYYLGVYNFNMGRNSYYNLGYYSAENTEAMVENIGLARDEDSFRFSTGTGEIISSLAIGEVQENLPDFDFHQFGSRVLFQPEGSDVTRMFGKDSKITSGGDIALAKGTLENFVLSVAKAGTYCFANIGKNPVSSRNDADGCDDRYTVVNQVPDVAWQFTYDEQTGKKIWTKQNVITFDNMKNDVDNLLQCISTTLKEEGSTNDPYLDFTSASEYYTICMAFGLIDSVMKNMNIKSWDGHKCYIAFYDMDCALGEDNAGNENITYLAATDYWHSEKVNGYLDPVTIDWDHWPETAGKGFDCKSSYLFAIVKYAQALLGGTMKLTHYPQEFWAIIRNTELKNADAFVDNYFKSGIGSVPSYLASLDYEVKYLYTGSVLDEYGNPTVIKPLANSSQFHGSRVEKVRTWLNRRLHFLDAMFNVQGVGIKIYGDVNVPIPTDYLNQLATNPDTTILSDIFSTSENNAVLAASNGRLVNIYAPKNTPFVLYRGGSAQIYLLSEEVGDPNPISLTLTQSFTGRFLGSKEFTKVSMVEPFLTTAYQVVSNNIEEVVYGESGFPPQNHNFVITSTSVKKIQMNIPDFNGELIISNDELNGQSVDTLNISGSGFYGTWDRLTNLQDLNISSINVPRNAIKILNCKLLKGERCVISGTPERLTYIQSLQMNDISGIFTLNNTSIEEISMSAIDGENATFEIDGDPLLRKLTLNGFSSVVVRNCPKLAEITINDSKTNEIDNINKCKKIVIDIPATYDEANPHIPLLKKFNSNTEGIFDFTGYTELEYLGVMGCYAAEIIKIPNHKVKVESFKNNINLEFVDTMGENSVIALTMDSTFYMCPRYGMRQSWNGKYSKPAMTKMCVDESCESLAHTFNKVYPEMVTKYGTEATAYENEMGQKVVNKPIDMVAAASFINDMVAGGGIDDAYVDDDGNIVDTTSNKVYGTDCRPNIKSLNGCFRSQKSISYTGALNAKYPNLSEFKSLTDVSGMYNATNVNFVNSNLLSFPEELNTNENELVRWAEFTGNSNMSISIDALKYISYRITDLSSLTFLVHKYEDGANTPTVCENLYVTDLLCVKTDESGEIIPLERFDRFTSFSISPEQFVDYQNMFDACPNITYLTSFLNTDLSNVKIDGMLKKCTKLKGISDSFNHTGNPEDLSNTIDLYDFFNWGENLDIETLFSSASNGAPGFGVKKTVSYDHFVEILNCLSDYKNIKSLSNIFSYCTIVGYDNTDEIVLKETMDKITSVNSLFYKCKGELASNGNDVPLNITRSFFEKLPNVVSVANTFAYTNICRSLTYDFFCKRRPYADPNTNVYVYENDEYHRATLHTHYYPVKITNMSGCFDHVKFWDCKSWFDINDNLGLVPAADYVQSSVLTSGESEDEYKVYTDFYYLKTGNEYVKTYITESDMIKDTHNNFTNYVKTITEAAISEFVINNHDIWNDMATFRNSNEAENRMIYVENDYNIYPTYCCLPPDILYGCSGDCNLSNAFGDTNIIGVIPQHLLSKCGSAVLKDMLVNTNILPNLFYHYDRKLDENIWSNLYNGDMTGYEEYKSNYLNLIAGIPIDIDDTVIMTPKSSTDEVTYELQEGVESTVLFRDSDGTLKRRRPRTGDDRSVDDINNTDYSKSQFVYVPQGYTTNRTLQQAFTFRYNLPNQVDLVSDDLASNGITWAKGNYGKEYGVDQKPYMWPHYTQYFLLCDESVKWSNVADMTRPFIMDGNDVDYHNGVTRVLSTTEEGNINSWFKDRTIIVDKGLWHNRTDGLFNVFLNLCGERDSRTGELKDVGCLISKALNNSPKLDGFVSGILGTFLNGMVFDNSTDAARFTSININGSKIVIFNGFGRNIILPNLQNLLPEDIDTSKVVLEYNSDMSRFYDFMFMNSAILENYKNRYFKSNANTVLISGNKFKIS